MNSPSRCWNVMRFMSTVSLLCQIPGINTRADGAKTARLPIYVSATPAPEIRIQQFFIDPPMDSLVCRMRSWTRKSGL